MKNLENLLEKIEFELYRYKATYNKIQSLELSSINNEKKQAGIRGSYFCNGEGARYD